MVGSQNDGKRQTGVGVKSSLAEEDASVMGDILGLMTHDLRNPLAALSSNAGFLKMIGDELTEDAREAVADLQLSVEAMNRIIDSLELFCHDLKGQTQSAPMPMTVSSCIRNVWGQVERAATSHGVQLSLELGAHESAQFLASEAMFQRALSALLHNALTVAPPGSTIRLLAESESDQLILRVEDAGPIVPAQLAEAILSAQGQVQYKTELVGRYSRGLGLYVVARSAELAGVILRLGQVEEKSSIELIAPLT